MDGLQLVNLTRQIALKRELETVANNMANVNTPGFKARSMRFAELLRGKASDTQDRTGPLSLALGRSNTIDFGDGALEKTGSPLDVAVQGANLFTVQTPQGERYTRDGGFRLYAQGRIVTRMGFPILGDGGPIIVAPGETDIAIADDGRVTTSGGEKGRLRLVTADDPAALIPEGDNLFATNAPLQPSPIGTPVVAGHIERANVRPMIEISRLVEISRAYASAASMMQKQDELKRNGVEKLATVPNGA
jgi:flagellar basal-body rod protein FlgF